MSKLIRAGLFRYKRSFLFWTCLCLSAISGIFVGYVSRKVNWNALYYIIPMLINASLISLIIGREFSDGMFRSKVAGGYTKGQLFICETILALSSTLVMYILHSACFSLFHHEVFKFVDLKILVLIFAGVMLTTLTFSALFILFSCLISRKAIASIMSIFLVVLLYIVGFETLNALKQPEFNQIQQVYDVERIDEYDSTVVDVPNERYVGGASRTVLEISEDISPYGQFLSYERIFSPMLNLRFITETNRPYGAHTYDEFLVTGVYTPDEESMQTLRSLPFYQIGLMIILLGSGYIIFRKKDFK